MSFFLRVYCNSKISSGFGKDGMIKRSEQETTGDGITIGSILKI